MFQTLLPGGTQGHKIDQLRNVRNAAGSHSFSLRKSANHIRFQILVLEICFFVSEANPGPKVLANDNAMFYKTLIEKK